ncbi:MAG: site-2 protease family protein [Acutalibacteraceae bacterium]|nr:site-2 protease family protein [Acutalibacteraceae bacterium]
MLLDLIRGGSFVNVVISILSSLFIIFCILPVHELAHAFVAHLCGDDTAKWQGRLTFNPVSHIDWFGAAAIILFGFGWAKPVPVNQNNFKNPKLDMALVGIAGPLANIISGFIMLALARLTLIFQYSTFILYVYYFFLFAARISISLAVFNLIPIPPLDGSRVLFAILPDRLYYKMMRYERFIYYAVLFLMITGAFSTPIRVATEFIMNLFFGILF